MNLDLDYTKTSTVNGKVLIPGSKSESNRLLILQELYPDIKIENLSNSEDTKAMQIALNLSKLSLTKSNLINIGHAGTTMRFLTAFFATQENKIITLTGSDRMQKRPIKILVNALLDLGADIKYLKKEGFPPLLIKGKKLTKNTVYIKGIVSSQYISALLLITPILPNGLELILKGKTTSVPYIHMTLALLNKIGANTAFKDNRIVVKPIQNLKFKIQNFTIEPDWSSASYYFSLAALKPNTKIKLPGFKKDSIQGDCILTEIYKKFGVKTDFTKEGIILKSSNTTLNFQLLTLNLKNTPDLAQTIAVTCLGLGINCHLKGLHTLKIKETDRLLALKNELEKFGAKITLTNSSLYIESPEQLTKNVNVITYQDHRMAMSFAPLSVKIPLQIENYEVVNKSYPDFWEDWNHLL